MAATAKTGSSKTGISTTAEILKQSAAYVDGDPDAGGSTNPTDQAVHELADGIAMVSSFSHVLAFDGGDGLVLFDTSLEMTAKGCIRSLRTWSTEPVDAMVFTHGHFDHVGGATALLDEASANGSRRPRVVGHEAVSPRFDRYEATNGYNLVINKRQFGDFGQERFGPTEWVHPDTTFSDRLTLSSGDLRFELRHAKGETDDHTWAWIPDRKAVCAGDFVTWVFPNAGNPQKVQRYPLEWAAALREMAALRPELLLGAHGLPVAGEERIQRVLDDLATALESLVHQTLDRMNAGMTLNDIIHDVALPRELLGRPYMLPIYDEPEFVVNNVWRLYGGWYDGSPDRLKPAADDAIAVEVADLAGGAEQLAERAGVLSAAGKHREACHLAEWAVRAAPENAAANAARSAVYRARIATETSLMAHGIFARAAEASEAVVASKAE